MSEPEIDVIRLSNLIGSTRGRGTPLGDAKDQMMRLIADSSITELAHDNPSSSRTTSELLPSPTDENRLIMLARNKELKGIPLKDETIAAMEQAHKQGAEFLVGDMPGVDEPFVRHLEKIGAKFNVFTQNKNPRFNINSPHNIVDEALGFAEIHKAHTEAFNPDLKSVPKIANEAMLDISDDIIPDDDYFSSLENTLESNPDYDPDISGSFYDDLDEARGIVVGEEIDELSKPVKVPKSGQRLAALETVVDELTDVPTKEVR